MSARYFCMLCLMCSALCRLSSRSVLKLQSGEAGLGSGIALTVSLLEPGTGGGDMLVVVRDSDLMKSLIIAVTFDISPYLTS